MSTLSDFIPTEAAKPAESAAPAEAGGVAASSAFDGAPAEAGGAAASSAFDGAAAAPQVAIAVVGPTASGKTALSIRLAKYFGAEIVSCDSMQVYRGMDIGTAKATPAEQAAVRHHMIDVADPDRSYSAADYAAEAGAVCADLKKRRVLPLFCGGTGLYLEGVRAARHRPELAVDPALREALEAEAAERGAEAMYAELQAVDGEAAAAIHPNNLRRVLRALEIFRATGKPKSVWDGESREVPPALRLCTLCLTPEDRTALHRRIDRRVEAMAEAGLRTEVEGLLQKGYLRDGSTASQAIGYKEYRAAIDGEITEAEALDEIRFATHRYARRQLTWFRAVRDAIFLPIGDAGIPAEAEDRALRTVEAFLRENPAF